jgi:hypothetical protein
MFSNWTRGGTRGEPMYFACKRLQAGDKIAAVRFEMYGFDMYNRGNLLHAQDN